MLFRRKYVKIRKYTSHFLQKSPIINGFSAGENTVASAVRGKRSSWRFKCDFSILGRIVSSAADTAFLLFLSHMSMRDTCDMSRTTETCHMSCETCHMDMCERKTHVVRDMTHVVRDMSHVSLMDMCERKSKNAVSKRSQNVVLKKEPKYSIQRCYKMHRMPYLYITFSAK